MDIIEEIKQKNDIIEVIGQYTKLSKSGKTYSGLCPFHSEKHGSFVVYPEQQSWHCFGACGTGGDVINFIMKKESLSFSEALKFLADKKGIIIPEKSSTTTENREKYARIINANELAAEFFSEQLNHSEEAENTRKYVQSRGLTPQTTAHFRLGYSPKSNNSLMNYLKERGYSETELLDAGLTVKKENGQIIDKFRGRLIFPIHNIKGQTVGFSGRDIDGGMPKYLNTSDTPVFSKSTLLYGLDYAKESIKKEDNIIIVEGYFDVILPHQNGYTNVVACMGTAIGEQHCLAIKKLTNNITLALDADTAGEQGMIRTIPLENIIDNEIKMFTVPNGKDPGELMLIDTESWPTLVKNAEPLVSHVLRKTLAKYDLSKTSDRTKAVDEITPILTNIQNPIRKAAYIEELALSTKVDKSVIIERLGQNKVITYTKKTEAPITQKQTANRPIEGFCLSLLIRHPEIIDKAERIKEEYLVSTENRAILRYIKGFDTELDPVFKDYYEVLANNEKADGLFEDKLEEVILRLREDYVKKSAIAAEGLAISEGQALDQIFKDKNNLISRNRSYYGQKEN